MKRKLLGLFIIPIALGAIGLVAVAGSSTHAQAANTTASKNVDKPEPGDTPDAKAGDDNNKVPDAETND